MIPTYDRPELLWLCLEHLVHSHQVERTQIRVCVDAHVDQPSPPRAEIEAVVAKFPQLGIQTTFRPPHSYPGNSFNVMMAYREAFETQARYVYLVEDDVLVHQQFFTWHQLMHAGRQIGCSIAVQNPGHGAYASLGVCFRRGVLQYLMPHCKPEYWMNMRGYCRVKFPPSKFDCEQDGLWARILAGRPVVWAPEPYAQHVGWYGYHRRRSQRPTGTLEERHRQVKQVLSSQANLRGWVRDFGDIAPIRSPCN